MSSLIKKYIMAITGLGLVGFVFVHMLGNLQIFLDPIEINAYGNFLHNYLPGEILWAFRIGLIALVVAHVYVAIKLTQENRAARPENYAVTHYNTSNAASRTMRMTGIIVLVFIIFHILHFTVQNIYPEFQQFRTSIQGGNSLDVYAMMTYGFSSKFWYVSAFYIFGMALLSWHLFHGVASMFQSLGLRNQPWREVLEKKIAPAVALIIFVGMSSIPASVLISEKTDVELVYVDKVLAAIDGWDGTSEIWINYESDNGYKCATAECATKCETKTKECPYGKECDGTMKKEGAGMACCTTTATEETSDTKEAQ